MKEIIKQLQIELSKLDLDDFHGLFSPTSYYNLNYEGAVKTYNYNNIDDFNIEVDEELISEIEEILYDRYRDLNEDEDDFENFISFDWYTIVNFLVKGRLSYTNYMCVPQMLSVY